MGQRRKFGIDPGLLNCVDMLPVPCRRWPLFQGSMALRELPGKSKPLGINGQTLNLWLVGQNHWW